MPGRGKGQREKQPWRRREGEVMVAVSGEVVHFCRWRRERMRLLAVAKGRFVRGNIIKRLIILFYLTINFLYCLSFLFYFLYCFVCLKNEDFVFAASHVPLLSKPLPQRALPGR